MKIQRKDARAQRVMRAMSTRDKKSEMLWVSVSSHLCVGLYDLWFVVKTQCRFGIIDDIYGLYVYMDIVASYSITVRKIRDCWVF